MIQRRVVVPVALAVWTAAAACAATVFIVASVSFLERRNGYCGQEGTKSREWIFELVPLGQTCDGDASLFGSALHASLSVLTLCLALVVVGGIIAIAGSLRRSRVASWIVGAVVLAAILAFVVVLAAHIGGVQDRAGVSLVTTWNASLAFIVGLFSATVFGAVFELTALGRAEPPRSG